jgi:hypothetical protein
MSEITMIEHYIKCVSKCVSKSDTPEKDCKKKCQNLKKYILETHKENILNENFPEDLYK